MQEAVPLRNFAAFPSAAGKGGVLWGIGLHSAEKKDMMEQDTQYHVIKPHMETEESVLFIADLHIHSRYSRATSREGDPEHLEMWARRKGIGLLGTGDFTHPAWRKELKEKLVPAEEGFYTLRRELCLDSGLSSPADAPRFVVSGEISSIYKKNGRVRKVHNVILLSGLEEADALACRLEEIGNIHSDGRPILGLDSRDLLEITLEVCPRAIFIPAHIWTPHFSLFGAFSGFDTIEECFEDLTPHIHALETGLSSDPPMNWRLSALDKYLLVSNSDAHSPSKLGREANIFDTERNYTAFAAALSGPQASGLAGTIEFFPEEGKYHFDGHRACRQCLAPSEAERANGRCPACGRKLTTGVLHRVEQLADREEGFVLHGARPYECLIPLPEVIGASTGCSAAGARTQARYEAMLRALGPEFAILRDIPPAEIEAVAGPCVAEGIRRMRRGDVKKNPGYDGEYGKIQLLEPEEIESLSGQLHFFSDAPSGREKKKSAAVLRAAVPKPETAREIHPASPAGAADELNEEQRAAVAAEEPAVAVVAGPGTGKTRTLVSRIVHLVLDLSVMPSNITAVTFTNKAAAEMRERLEKALGGKRLVREMTIGTFHSIGLRLLEEQGTAAVLADAEDAQAVAAEILEEQGMTLPPSRLLRAVSRRKNGLEPEGSVPPEAVEAYCRRLEETGRMDFDDILCRALELAEKVGGKPKRFTHLLVDEFQDINDLQYRLIRAWHPAEGLAPGEGSLFVIGDPDQAIYGFRGSDSRCFEKLSADYPALRRIRLVQNYRSAPAILRCALAAIDPNKPDGEERRLLPRQEENGPVRLLEAPDDFSEAIFIAKEINRIVGGMDMLDAQTLRTRSGSHGFSEIAVLYRTHRQAEALETCLKKEGIPYVVNGREPLLSEKPVRIALAFFRSLLEPADKEALYTALTALDSGQAGDGRTDGGAGGRGRALHSFCRSETSFQQERRLHSPQEWAAGLPAPFARHEGARRWAELAVRYLPTVGTQRPDVLLDDWARVMSGEGEEPLLKLRNMALFHPTMLAFLHNLLTGEEGDLSRSGGKRYQADSVTLMTMHASKGLEFPIVFLCGLRKGVVPLEMPGRSADLAEERRLLYVGMTRAKEELLLLTGGELSPFLAALPQTDYERGRTLESPYPYGAKQLSLFD